MRYKTSPSLLTLQFSTPAEQEVEFCRSVACSDAPSQTKTTSRWCQAAPANRGNGCFEEEKPLERELTRGRRGLGGEKNLHSVTHWSAFTVALAGQFSALQIITLLQRKPNSPARPTSSPSFGGERSLLKAHSMSHHQTGWVMPLTPSSSVLSKYTILHPLPICPNHQGCHSTAVLVLHPFLMESHICQTNDCSHKVVSALAGENSLPRNGTVFFISLPTHLAVSSVLACPLPASLVWQHGFNNSF